MSTAGTMEPHIEGKRAKPRSESRVQVTSLDELVGAHPATLRAMFAEGQAADPRELGDAPHGRLLGIEPARDVNGLVRPIVRAIAGPLPWKGKTFHAGGSGANRVFGRETAAFTWKTEASVVDGEPALVLSYAERPWPLRAVHDELRMVADGIAIGPIVARTSAGHVVIGWFGLERSRS